MNRVNVRIRMLRGTRVLKGDRSDRDRHVARPSPLIPKCPAALGPEARREFRRLAPRLVALGLVSEIDGAILAAFCAAHAVFMQASAEFEAAGRKLLATGPKRRRISASLLKIIADGSTAMRRAPQRSA